MIGLRCGTSGTNLRFCIDLRIKSEPEAMKELLSPDIAIDSEYGPNPWN